MCKASGSISSTGKEGGREGRRKEGRQVGFSELGIAIYTRQARMRLASGVRDRGTDTK